MKIDAIEASALEIPFRSAFRHASAERAAMQSVWVLARSGSHSGCGEGCPVGCGSGVGVGVSVMVDIGVSPFGGG